MKKEPSIQYTIRELLESVHKKLDRIEERLIIGDKNFAKINNTLKWHFRAISALYAVLSSFLIKPIKWLFGKI